MKSRMQGEAAKDFRPRSSFHGGGSHRDLRFRGGGSSGILGVVPARRCFFFVVGVWTWGFRRFRLWGPAVFSAFWCGIRFLGFLGFLRVLETRILLLGASKRLCGFKKLASEFVEGLSGSEPRNLEPLRIGLARKAWDRPIGRS